jgi:hypothetical protein
VVDVAATLAPLASVMLTELETNAAPSAATPDTTSGLGGAAGVGWDTEAGAELPPPPPQPMRTATSAVRVRRRKAISVQDNGA